MRPAEEARAIRYSLLSGQFAICRLAPDATPPAWALQGKGFVSITRASDELSVVCNEEDLPQQVKADDGWTCFKLEGPFPLSETGVLVSFIRPLSENAIPIFAISTFDTDYVLIKANFVERAMAVLRAVGHELTPNPAELT